jgi:hypothetical protein
MHVIPTSCSLARETTHAERAVNNVHSKVERFREEAEVRVDLDQPVGEDFMHLPCQVLLAVHIVRVREGRLL